MRKLTTLLLLLFLTTSAFGQFFVPHQKPPLGLQVNGANPFSDPISLWLFNEGSGGQVFDLSRNGHTGTFQNTPTWIPGKYGSAIDFDSGDTITCGNNVDLTVPFTIVTSFKSDDATQTYMLINTKKTASDYYGVCLYQNNTKIVVQYNDGGAAGLDARKTFTSDDTISTGVWYHVVASVLSATEAVIVINGVSSTYVVSGTGGALVNGDYPCLIGQFNDDNLFYFVGQMGFMKVYDRGFSVAEATQLYREPFCMIEPSWNWVLYGGISVPAAGAPQVIFIN